MSLDAVVKVGGSLLEGGDVPALLLALRELASSAGLLVVPGGGPFADAVREVSDRYEAGESAAHWMAILGMDQHAHLLQGLEPRAMLVSDPASVGTVTGRGRLAILAPFAWLRTEDPLPHGWHVTSDSIAAFVAARLKARRLVLLKSVDGAEDEAGALLETAEVHAPGVKKLVDGYFARARDPGLESWILSGRHPGRVGELLKTGRALGTRLR